MRIPKSSDKTKNGSNTSELKFQKTAKVARSPKCKYRVKELTPGRFQILPVPATGEAAVKFHAEIKKIAKELFRVGAALDSICGSFELIFQHNNPQVNKERIAQIIKIWEERQSPDGEASR